MDEWMTGRILESSINQRHGELAISVVEKRQRLSLCALTFLRSEATLYIS